MRTRDTADDIRVYYRFEEIDEEPSASIEAAPSTPEPIRSIFTPKDGRIGFWRRQFGSEVTTKQKAADWIFGVLMPLVCFAFDPIVFRGSFEPGGAIFKAYQVPAYVIAFGSIMALAAWLLWGDDLGQWKRPVGIVMGIGAVFAAVMGLVLFPYSVLGLLFLIGILGFTPFFTAIIYWRNAVRAMRRVPDRS